MAVLHYIFVSNPLRKMMIQLFLVQKNSLEILVIKSSNLENSLSVLGFFFSVISYRQIQDSSYVSRAQVASSIQAISNRFKRLLCCCAEEAGMRWDRSELPHFELTGWPSNPSSTCSCTLQSIKLPPLSSKTVKKMVLECKKTLYQEIKGSSYLPFRFFVLHRR